MFSRTQMGWQPWAWAGSLRRGWTLVPGAKAHSRLTDAQHWALSPQGAELARLFPMCPEPSVECLFKSALQSSYAIGGNHPHLVIVTLCLRLGRGKGWQSGSSF